ncbi:MAG TPA: LysE family translocator [Pseudonocardia sp.]|nr:LysE family translocator [Pseudonocardia sp.]
MHPLGYLPLLAAWLVMLISPGPDLLLVLRISMSQSRRSGVLAGVGVITGTTCWVIGALAGVTVLLDRYRDVYFAVRLAGAAFLIFLGLSALRSAWRRAPVRLNRSDAGGPAPKPMSGWQCWRAGLLCNLSNPKALVFFGALFATVLPPHVELGDRVFLLLGLTGSGLGWLVVVAVLASVPSATRVYERARRGVDTVTGGLFVAVGGALVPR